MSIVGKLLSNPSSFSIEMLQRGVQSGTVPAYIGIPLIQQKLQEKKAMSGAQAQAGMQQQQQTPTPAEQVMAEASQATAPRMAPMAQAAPGIGGLQSNLPSKFAGGGIVAFADGGGVPSDVDALIKRLKLADPDLNEGYVRRAYAEAPPEKRQQLINMLAQNAQGSPMLASAPAPTPLAVTPTPAATTPQSQEERDRKLFSEGLESAIAAGKDVITLPGRAILGAAETAITRPLRAMGVDIPYASRELYGGDASSMTPYYDALRRARGEDKVAPAPAPAPEQKAPEQKAPPEADAGGIASLGSGIRVPGMSMPKYPGVEGPSYKEMAKEYSEQYGKEYEARKAEHDKARDALRKSVTGEPLAEYKKSLEQEALQAGADKKQAALMATFKAGLAMMSGSSPYALQNIGAGAMVGASDYQAAIKDIKKAEKERQKSLALVEQAQRAEKIGDRDAAMRAMDKSYDRDEAARRYIAESVYKGGIADRKQSYDVAKDIYKEASAAWRTQTAADATLGAAGLRARNAAGVTQYQLASLREKVAKSIDPLTMRSEVAKSLRMSKVPAPGQDAEFDRRVNEVYARRIDEQTARLLSGSTGANTQSFAGYKLVGPE